MKTEIERFMEKIANTAECHLWSAGCNENGYGQFELNDRTRYAHVAAYELFIGPVPPGMHIDHTCHNRDANCLGGKHCPHRRCVNPAHLEAVTQAENNQRKRKRPPGSLPARPSVRRGQHQCPQGRQARVSKVRPDARGAPGSPHEARVIAHLSRSPGRRAALSAPGRPNHLSPYATVWKGTDVHESLGAQGRCLCGCRAEARLLPRVGADA